MSGAAWQIEHSVETTASLEFAWRYVTHVANWDDPPAVFRLEGPFVEGSRGTTQIPGQEPMNWQLRQVRPMECYTFEMLLDRAVLFFEWKFRDAR
jgi:hypothetical protein